MSEASKAVFLSYAREDAAPARLIAEALRNHGIEVWFDQAELRGGDAWDQKIRKEIKECALFVPVISAHTEERHEGYFRLEWSLAEERTHLMARGVPFILPVVIDATNEARAVVPERFREVQWFRLPGGDPKTEFLERVKRLIEQPRKSPFSGHAVRSDEPARPPAAVEPPRYESLPMRRPPTGRRWLGLGLAVGAIALGLWVVLTRFERSKSEAPNPTPPLSAAGSAKVEAKSLAVLPLENLSPDPENAFFTDGVHSEIISTLLRLSDLKVISRNAVQAFKGSTVALSEIGRKLGVENVITGSVRRAGDQVRIQLELRRAHDEALLWTQDYNRPLKDVLAVQSEIAGEVAKVLQARASNARLGRAEFLSKNPRAYDLYLKARELQLAGFPSAARARQIIPILKEVIALEPDFEPAATGLSSWYTSLFIPTTDPAEQLSYAAEAKRWGETAARLLPGGAGDRALAYYYSRVEPDSARAVALALNAVRAMPNDPGNHNTLAIALLFAGRAQEAVAEYQLGLGDDGAVTVRQNLITALTLLRRTEESRRAIAQLRAEAGGRESAEGLAQALYRLGDPIPVAGMSAMQRIPWLGRERQFEAQLAAIETQLATGSPHDVDRLKLLLQQVDASRRLGREAAAENAARSALALTEQLQGIEEFDRSNKDGRRAHVLARMGRADEAIAAGQRFATAKFAAGSVRIRWDREIELAELYAYLKRPRECVELLGKLLQVPSGITVPMLRLDPAWDNVREDAGFKALLADPKNSAPL